ncbi:MAG TPA: hypothetical protein VGM53_26215 [Streptosporangiaceae bacterium]
MQSAQLKVIRRTDPDGQGRHSFTAQQQTLRRLSDVFAAFYRRCKAQGKKPGYPRFKPYSRFDQVRFVNGNGAKWVAARNTCILTGKAEEAARRIVLVNPAGTNITCHQCGQRCTRPGKTP